MLNYDPEEIVTASLRNAEWAAIVSMAYLALECGNRASNLRLGYDNLVNQLRLNTTILPTTAENETRGTEIK